MRLIKTLLLASAFVLTPLAFAETLTFDFSGYAAPLYNPAPGSGGITVSGSFVAESGFQGLANVWEIKSVTGYVINPGSLIHVPITGLVADPTEPYTVATADGFIYDDLFYTSVATLPSFSVPYPIANGFDYWGLLFTTASPNAVNLFSNSGGPVYATDNYAYGNTNYFGTFDPDSRTPSFLVTPTPEPSSLILLGTGVLGAAVGLRRKIAARL